MSDFTSTVCPVDASGTVNRRGHRPIDIGPYALCQRLAICIICARCSSRLPLETNLIKTNRRFLSDNVLFTLGRATTEQV